MDSIHEEPLPFHPGQLHKSVTRTDREICYKLKSQG